MDNWNRESLRQIVEQALDASHADATVMRVRCFREGATRFANSEITQNIVRSDAAADIETAFGQQVGRCATNRLTADAVVACVRRAEAMARVTPPDPEYMPPVTPGPCSEVPIWQAATADFSPHERLAAIRQAVAVAEREKMTGAGVFTSRALAWAVGNSAGLFRSSQETDAMVTFSATSPDSVGWAQSRARDVSSLDIEATARRAVEKARAGRSPKDAPAGAYEVVLEPAAVAELLAFFFFYQMDAKATDEGRTFLSGKKGRQLAAPNVTIFSDPTADACPSRPFTDEGLALGRVNWIRNGVLESSVYSRYWAKKQGVAPTGIPTNVVMQGGDASVDDMIRSVRRGIYVTRFWYVRVVEPMNDLYTGMTRDGTFLIEDGRIAGPVKNLRFNESVVRLLSSVELLGTQETTGGMVWASVPFLKAGAFQFTSTTRF